MVPLQLVRWTLDVRTPEGLRNVLDDVSLCVPAATTVALVGESGSGKSTVALGALGLLDEPPFVHRSGAVWLGGNELSALPESRRAPLRPGRAAMVFQDPGAALNPTLRLGAQLDEVTRLQRNLGRGAARAATLQALREVGLADAERVAACYPHVLSGGMRQRAMVAMALLGTPALLVADEPTTALDVTVQAQLLALLRTQARARQMACLLVTHDLGVVAGVADQVAVLYAGRVVEEAPVAALFAQPRHPYTAALLAAARDLSVPALPGTPPEMPKLAADGTGRPARCDFAPRCPRADARCHGQAPPLAPCAGGAPSPRQVRCHYPLADGESWAALCRPSGAAPGRARPYRPGEDGARASAVAPTEAAPATAGEGAPVALRLRNVDVRYGAGHGRAWLPWKRTPTPPTVQGVSLAVAAGEIVALVGESGSGKSTLARAVLQLLPLARGEVWLQQHHLTALWHGGAWTGGRRPGRHLRRLRPRLQAVFQDPRASLNPRHTALAALMEPLMLHRPELGVAARRERALALLAEVGLPATLAGRRPQALSGGQRQRLALARALAPDPSVLLADEPTSALDVGVKGQVLELLRQVGRSRKLATLLISHDLAAVRALAHRTAVMVAGTVVELGPTAAVTHAPKHPYTQALLAAEPVADPAVQPGRLEGLLPVAEAAAAAGGALASAVTGCRYRRRCAQAVPTCEDTPPALREVAPGHFVACHVTQSL